MEWIRIETELWSQSAVQSRIAQDITTGLTDKSVLLRNFTLYMHDLKEIKSDLLKKIQWYKQEDINSFHFQMHSFFQEIDRFYCEMLKLEMEIIKKVRQNTVSILMEKMPKEDREIFTFLSYDGFAEGLPRSFLEYQSFDLIEEFREVSEFIIGGQYTKKNVPPFSKEMIVKIEEQVFSDLLKEDADFLLEIHAVSVTLETFVNTLLAFSLSESDNVQHNIRGCISRFRSFFLESSSSLHFTEVVNKVVQRYSDKILDISFSFSGDDILMSDPDILLRFLGNALDNTLHHAFTGISLEKRKVVVSAEVVESNGLKIQISDNGNGISSEQLNKVFEPSVTTKLGNSGVALSEWKNLLENNNGSISFESTQNEGSVLTVLFPKKILSVNPEKNICKPKIIRGNIA